MIGSNWKLTAAVALAMAAAVATPRLAAAKDDNGGGLGGKCWACTTNYLSGDSFCVTHGTGYSSLFGMTKCDTTVTYVPRGVILGCELSGLSCMSGMTIPLFPGYL